MALLVAGLGPAAAQGSDCDGLRRAIRAAENDNGQRDTSGIQRAAQQQRSEIERTRRYAEQIGCNQSRFQLFGDGPPPECDDIQDRLGRMQDNLDQIQGRLNDDQPSGNAARAAALIARYNATCVAPGGSLAGSGQDGGGYAAFDGHNPADLGADSFDSLSTVPLNGDIMEDGGSSRQVAGRTICVRTCDGGYFPLAPRASSDQLDGLDQLCKASCPNTEARLYTMRDGDLGAATAVDGTTYMALPAAFKYEKTFTPACSCKPPGQSWADALAGAEKLLEKGDRHDVTVTSALSDQMARPLAAPAGKNRGAKGQPPSSTLPDRKIAADALRAAQAPTAGNASSGIGGPVASDRVLGRADGLRITSSGPDGVNRQIRLIVP